MKNQTRGQKSHVLTKSFAIAMSAVMVMATPAMAVGSGATWSSNDSNGVAAASTAQDYELVDNVQDAAILHCWNWSYKTIEEHLQLIAECGYSAIQTSPATQPKDYTYEGEVGMEVGIPGIGGSGNWWKLYQPVAEEVCDNGETWLGTKEELQSLCEKAESYGIKVIVDVVANHMANITGWKNSLDDVSPQVGEYWNPDMLTDESFWHINDLQIWMSDGREHFTQGTMGMPDLNTADWRVQKYISDYLVELIDCGVDGFRFDAAKHIETPDDDPAYASDFWPNVLGVAESHYAAVTGEDLYVYGEILNTVGLNFSIDSYTKYMSVTDNSAGNHLFDAYRNNNIGSLHLNYAADKTVLWAESHDTYMNEASRYGSDKSIMRTWAMVANKDNAAALFFVRPYYSSETLVDDKDGSFRDDLSTSLEPAIMGECETYTWATNEVAAINHFNNRFVDCADYMGSDGNVAYCVRGQGIILVSFNGAGNISMSSHGLADGVYTDEVSGNTFTVSDGVINGYIASEHGIAVIYQNVMPNPGHDYAVQVGANVGDNTVFYTESLEVTLTAKYADTAEYEVSTGEKGTFTGSTTITVGKNLAVGEAVTVTVRASNGSSIAEKTYTYTKAAYDLTNCVFFENNMGWTSVTAYMWNDTQAAITTNASWPGEAMFECNTENNIYALSVDVDAGFNKIIFSNSGSSQTADLDFGGIGFCYDSETGTWYQYKEQIDDSLDEDTDIDDGADEDTDIDDGTDDDTDIDDGADDDTDVDDGTDDDTDADDGADDDTDVEDGTDDDADIEDETDEDTDVDDDTDDVVENKEEIFFDVAQCGWFGNDNAVAAVKFDTDTEFAECETESLDGKTYYKAEVPAGATSVTLCRMLPSGATYNAITFSLVDGMNLWTSYSGFNGGDWSSNAALGDDYSEESDEKEDTEDNAVTVYFTNNYNWAGTIRAYFWGSAEESVSWPGVEMTYAGVDSNGYSVYEITVPRDIAGIIFTNGSAQTVDITMELEEDMSFSISGSSGSKYDVSVE